MSGTDIVALPLSLLFEKLVELASRFASFTVVALLFALATVLFEETEEVEEAAAVVVEEEQDSPVPAPAYPPAVE